MRPTIPPPTGLPPRYPEYIGDYQSAPLPFRAAVERLPAALLLLGTEWERGCYVPARRPEFDAEVGVLFRPFRWDEHSPWVWLLATTGLSAIAQPRQKVKRSLRGLLSFLRNPPLLAFHNFELAAAFLEPEGWEEFRAALTGGSLAEFGDVPAVFRHFALIAQDFASWMVRHHETFEMGDPVLNAALVSPFPSALLVPPVPELMEAGVRPFRIGPRGAIEVTELPKDAWKDRQRLAKAGDHGFLQLAPLMHEEFLAARDGQGWEFFLDGLLPRESELREGRRPSTHIADLTRDSRVGIFRAGHA